MYQREEKWIKWIQAAPEGRVERDRFRKEVKESINVGEKRVRVGGRETIEDAKKGDPTRSRTGTAETGTGTGTTRVHALPAPTITGQLGHSWSPLVELIRSERERETVGWGREPLKPEARSIGLAEPVYRLLYRG